MYVYAHWHEIRIELNEKKTPTAVALAVKLHAFTRNKSKKMTFRCSLIPRFSSSNSYSSSSMSSSRSLSRCLRFSPSASLSLPLPLPLPLPSPSPSASSSAWSTINPSRFVSCASSSSAESIILQHYVTAKWKFYMYLCSSNVWLKQIEIKLWSLRLVYTKQACTSSSMQHTFFFVFAVKSSLVFFLLFEFLLSVGQQLAVWI